MSIEDMIFRLGLASLAGILLGLDREIRGIAAGIRTHALVALSSALITISALMLYQELSLSGGSNIDPLRVVQGSHRPLASSPLARFSSPRATCTT